MIFSLERFRAKSLKQQLDFETRSYRAGIVAIGGNTIMNVGNMMELAMQKREIEFVILSLWTVGTTVLISALLNNTEVRMDKLKRELGIELLPPFV